ncbi:Atrochrysone carboxylic acid synthase [Dissostichus eleginoides]|uniref:Atrochrysone carboxylic acid synthase n=1 Tax=Dissostichus eleginoides TaxID=100907 RepID=A0AAD9C193_DISEL|nr:Atrochrysone carboxylic acid synthase [Dissostichus eleginoides]
MHKSHYNNVKELKTGNWVGLPSQILIRHIALFCAPAEKISRLEVLASPKTVVSTFWFHFQRSWQLNKMHFHPLSLSGPLSMPGLALR